jgi:hypothetical protein
MAASNQGHVMSRWLWLAALASLALVLGRTPSAPAQSASCLVTPGRSIGPLSLGLSRDDVVRLWGAPDRVEPMKNGGQWLEFRLLRLGAVALNAEGRAIFVAVSEDPCLKTVEGLASGDVRSRSRALYGEPAQIASESFADVVVKRKYRVRIGTSFKDYHLDVYPGRGLGLISKQTMHLNGYAADGTPIMVPIDPEPTIETFTVEFPRQQAMVAHSRHGVYQVHTTGTNSK